MVKSDMEEVNKNACKMKQDEQRIERPHTRALAKLKTRQKKE